ncbi:hypothetical protein [Cecembia lonarensis]|uniref:hypothetical protein n=1 Tax=Cecembia lonarensis TaxID=645110 RepID=UPI0012F7F91A|nr:hypothetical protein [Cecembia lonarensis]
MQKEYGYEFHIIQFIWGDRDIIDQRRVFFDTAGIKYIPIITNRKFAIISLLKAKFFDSIFFKNYIKEKKIEVIIPRATTALGIFEGIIQKTNVDLVYDADGFSQDERVDFSGLSKNSLRYKLYRRIEKEGFIKGKSIICRSLKAKEIIMERAGDGFDKNKVFIVRNGTFKSTENQIKSSKTGCNLVYSGSIGPQYRMDEVIQIFEYVKDYIPNASLTLLTPQVEVAKELIKKESPQFLNVITVKSVFPDLILSELKNYHIGISLRKATFSMQAVAPLKVGEYLAAGLSVIFSPGIGDMDILMKNKPFAFCFDGFNESKEEEILNWVNKQLKEDYSEAIQEMAIEYFSLEETAKVYHQALQYG